MRRKRRNQKKMIIILSLSLLMVITVGYAAFGTISNNTPDNVYK